MFYFTYSIGVLWNSLSYVLYYPSRSSIVYIAMKSDFKIFLVLVLSCAIRRKMLLMLIGKSTKDNSERNNANSLFTARTIWSWRVHLLCECSGALKSNFDSFTANITCQTKSNLKNFNRKKTKKILRLISEFFDFYIERYLLFFFSLFVAILPLAK